MLLVEDNFINQQVARGILEAEGAVITTADNGAIGLDLLRHAPQAFDLVLMDVQMPVMGGLEATRRIRSELRLSLPVIAMSAGVLKGERDVCAEAGMNDFIPKPLDPQVVVTTLRKLELKVGREPEPAASVAAQPALPEARPLTRSTRSGAPVIAGIAMDQLVDALNGNRKTAERLLLRLAQECETVIAKLDAGIAAGDAKAVDEALHGFKGVTANMRAEQVSAQTAALEASLRANGVASLAELMPSFRLNVAALREAVLGAGLSAG
jgi:CheY-like chemotaxis protein